MTKLTKEQIEKERVKFEEWIKQAFPNPNNTHDPLSTYHDGIYEEWSTFLMFESWKSRAELDKGE